MEAHAASGDWDKVEELAGRLRSAVMAVPEDQRRATLLAAHRTIEQIQELAQLRPGRGHRKAVCNPSRQGCDASLRRHRLSQYVDICDLNHKCS